MKVFIGPYPENNDEKRIVEVEIHKYDSWNVENTLSKIIHPLLVQFRANLTGAPNVDDEDVPDEIKSTSAPKKENEWENDTFHFDRWDYVLDEMIWAFDNWMDGKWEEPYYTKGNSLYENYEHKKETYLRLKNGFRLFGKYYTNLWD